MYTLLLITGIFFLIASIYAILDKKETLVNHGILNRLLFVLVGTAIGFVIALAVTFIISIECRKSEPRKSETYTLISLKDNSSGSGNFFLGSGYYRGRMIYTFYYKAESGGIRLEQIDSDQAEIFYSNKTYIDKYETYGIKNPWLFGGDGKMWCCPTYKIYVPEGTIKKEYNLDAE